MGTPALLVTASALAALAVLPQQPADRQTFRSGREVLTVEAAVRDRAGTPLTGLQPSDFTVLVDGQPRAVLTAHLFGDGVAERAEPNPIGRFLRATDAAQGFVAVVVVDRESIKAGDEHFVVDAAAAMVEGLSPADAAAAVSVPGEVVDVSRDRRAVAAALRRMTGTRPLRGWIHHLAWREALAFQRDERITIAGVLSRECPPNGPRELDPCPGELKQQALEMVVTGRMHAERLLATLTRILDDIEVLRAPKRLVLLSGGLPFDEELASRYRAVADRAARAHVALSVVQVDQPLVDIADALGIEASFAGPEYEAGLANLASVTGGTFAHVTARPGGVFDRIRTDLSHFYQLGVESRPSDADGRAHRIEVRVARPGATVVAAGATSVATPLSNESAIERALRQPLPVSELPFDAAFYAVHSRDRDKVRVIVAAHTPDGVAPDAWGFAFLQDGKVVEGRTIPVSEKPSGAWTASAAVDVAPGTYGIRVAAAATDGRMAVIDATTPIGLRGAGTTQASDLMIGTVDGGAVQPRETVRQDEATAALIELSSAESLQDVHATVQVMRSGSGDPALRAPLALRTRSDDSSVVVAEGRLDLSGLAPGSYSASAVLERDGRPFARITRTIEVEAGALRPAPIVAREVPKTSLGHAARAEPETVALMERVGEYVENYGEQASVLIAVERYRQDSSRVSQSSLPGTPYGLRGRMPVTPTVTTTKTVQTLTSEIALVRNAAAVGGWLGFRSVTEVDGKPTGEPARLRTLFAGAAADLEAARRLTEESTRYNVGPVKRTFNVPTATLFFFTPANLPRFTFHHNGEERIDGTVAWKIDFQETATPTIVMTGGGRDIRSTGTLWVDPADGRVLRTRMMLTNYSGPSSSAIVEVSYRAEPAMNMLVPGGMREWYSVAQGRLAAEATYADYKRFQTSIRIK